MWFVGQRRAQSDSKGGESSEPLPAFRLQRRWKRAAAGAGITAALFPPPLCGERNAAAGVNAGVLHAAAAGVHGSSITVVCNFSPMQKLKNVYLVVTLD